MTLGELSPQEWRIPHLHPVPCFATCYLQSYQVAITNELLNTWYQIHHWSRDSVITSMIQCFAQQFLISIYHNLYDIKFREKCVIYINYRTWEFIWLRFIWHGSVPFKHSGTQRAFQYQSSGRSCSRNFMESAGGVQMEEETSKWMF